MCDGDVSDLFNVLSYRLECETARENAEARDAFQHDDGLVRRTLVQQKKVDMVLDK